MFAGIQWGYPFETSSQNVRQTNAGRCAVRGALCSKRRREDHAVRSLIMLVGVAVWLSLASAAFAQSHAQSAPPNDQPANDQPAGDQPTPGPILQPSDHAPVLCDPATPGFRYVEVRGSGFDA